jgi:hypothetical protein
VVGEDPAGYHFVNGAKEAIGGDLFVEVSAKTTILLTLTDGFADEAKVFDHVFVRKRGEETGALAKLHLENDGEIAIGSERTEMHVREPAKFVRRRGDPGEFGSSLIDEGVKSRVDGRHQDLFFILEVEIDGSVGDSGPGGDVCDAGDVETFFGEHGDGGIEDALVLFARGSRSGDGLRLRVGVFLRQISFPLERASPDHSRPGRASSSLY